MSVTLTMPQFTTGNSYKSVAGIYLKLEAGEYSRRDLAKRNVFDLGS